MDPTVKVRRDLDQNHLDWWCLIRLATKNRIITLLHWHLNERWRGRIPAILLDELSERFQENTRFSLSLAKELVSVLKLLEDEGIPVVPYKGVQLAESLYGNVALRQCRDLDLLVPRADVMRVKDLLVERGYQPEPDLRGRQERERVRSKGEMSLVRRDLNIVLEVHWILHARYFASLPRAEELWLHVKPTRFQGHSVLAFEPEVLLVLLCMHGAKHAWARLKWICDVAELVRKYPELDWERVWDWAESVRATRMVRLGLYLAGELLGVELPEHCTRRVAEDRCVPRLGKVVMREVMSLDDELPSGGRLVWFHLRAKDGVWERVRYLWLLGTTTTDGDWAVVRLPDWLFSLYYLVRIGRLGVRPFLRMGAWVKGRIVRKAGAGESDEEVGLPEGIGDGEGREVAEVRV